MLVLELLAAASFYIKRHTVVEISREAADGPTELEGDRAGEVFGIGIESGGPLFWFHRKTETETAGWIFWRCGIGIWYTSKRQKT